MRCHLRRSGVWLIAAALLPAGVRSCAAIHAVEPVTLETIAKAWQARQDRVRSARFLWTEQRTDAKGALSSAQPPVPPDKDSWGGKVLPPQDVTYEAPVKAVFQGDALHYSYTAQFWSPKENGLKKMPYVKVFDNNTGKYLSGSDLITSWPFGAIQNEGSPIDAKRPQLRPILMTYRACHPKLHTYDIEQLSFTGRRTLIGGHSCLELVLQNQSFRGLYIVHLWVDPARDYVIVREVNTEGDKLVVQLNVQFVSDPIAGWVPQTWDITAMHPNGSGKFWQGTKAKVTEYEINSNIDKKEFDIDWPVGTYVSDIRTNDWYIVTPGGGKRHVPPEERNKTYEELIEPSALTADPSFLHSPWRIVAFILCVVSGTVLAWRLRSRHKSKRGDLPNTVHSAKPRAEETS